MKKFLAPVLGLLLAVSLLTIEPAAAQLIDPADSPNNITTATGGEGSARSLARTIINFFLYFLGLVATIMVIYGGFLYITAGGGDTEKAKKVLLYAAIGIIVVLISFALVNTLLRSADGVSTGFGRIFLTKIKRPPQMGGLFCEQTCALSKKFIKKEYSFLY
ncbi:MAG: pilin [Candidatus Gracilibacteria bacterium]|nr:pilin [Candidatus Gracilibacteria bacterium]